MTEPESLGDVWRQVAPDVLAAVARRSGDFGSAEDAVQDALAAATRQWPLEGRPDDPAGWLIRVASRRLVDSYRAEHARLERERAIWRADPAHRAAASLAGADTDLVDARPAVDDSVTLLVLCCHPALPRPSQVALTLRAIGGLTTRQIAQAFLVPEATMAQRISRAKTRLREMNARFTPPPPAELPARVAAVIQVLYLIFTEGHTSTVGPDLQDVLLADEAIRITRRLRSHLPTDPEVAGLLALMLLTRARQPARTDADGALVPLASQDRRRWNADQIAEGIALVEAALPHGPVGPVQLQAAIAAVHAEARHAGDTDWPQIAELYRLLDTAAPGAMVTLNRAVAVAMVEGPSAGLRQLEPLLHDASLTHHHRLHAVRAHLLEQAGEREQARREFLRAAQLATALPEQRYATARAEALR